MAVTILTEDATVLKVSHEHICVLDDVRGDRPSLEARLRVEIECGALALYILFQNAKTRTEEGTNRIEGPEIQELFKEFPAMIPLADAYALFQPDAGSDQFFKAQVAKILASCEDLRLTVGPWAPDEDLNITLDLKGIAPLDELIVVFIREDEINYVFTRSKPAII